MEHTFWYTKNIGFFYSLLAFIEGAPNRWYNLAVIFKSSTWQSYVPVVMYLYSMKEKHTNISCPVTVHTKWVLAHFTIYPSLTSINTWPLRCATFTFSCTHLTSITHTWTLAWHDTLYRYLTNNMHNIHSYTSTFTQLYTMISSKQHCL